MKSVIRVSVSAGIFNPKFVNIVSNLSIISNFVAILEDTFIVRTRKRQKFYAMVVNECQNNSSEDNNAIIAQCKINIKHSRSQFHFLAT